jgi:hypothetical protein
MNSMLIFWPVLAQVVLTILVFILMGYRKAKSIKAGTVNRKAAALDNRVWPTDVVQVSNNIANQFETPKSLCSCVCTYRLKFRTDQNADFLIRYFCFTPDDPTCRL